LDILFSVDRFTTWSWLICCHPWYSNPFTDTAFRRNSGQTSPKPETSAPDEPEHDEVHELKNRLSELEERLNMMKPKQSNDVE